MALNIENYKKFYAQTAGKTYRKSFYDILFTNPIIGKLMVKGTPSDPDNNTVVNVWDMLKITYIQNGQEREFKSRRSAAYKEGGLNDEIFLSVLYKRSKQKPV